MLLARIVLWAGAVVFAGIGIGFLLMPVAWARVVDIELPTTTARTDLRATYGGFDLAVGIFLGVCALRPEWLGPGLAACGLTLAGFAAGRMIGFLVERAASRLLVVFAVVEIAGAGLAFYALAHLPQTPI